MVDYKLAGDDIQDEEAESSSPVPILEETPEESSGDEGEGAQSDESTRTSPLGPASGELWQKPAQGKPKNDMSDLFAVPQPGDNDISTEDLLEVPEEDFELEEDLSDLTTIPSSLLSPSPRPKSRFKPHRRNERENKPRMTIGGVG